MLSQQDIQAELVQAEEELKRCQQKIAQLRKHQAQTLEQDYIFSGVNHSQVRLSELFGKHEDMILIHNMGAGCMYCTMWADGLNGLFPHLQNRAAFVVISPDDPEAQQRFAQSRGWKFRLFSSQGTTFSKDMGFLRDNEQWPGVSTFHKDEDGIITRIAHDFFGPGDHYCAAWHLFDLLPGGSEGWEPQYVYKD